MRKEPDHIPYSDDDLFNPETHHETSDVNVRALIIFGIVFLISSVFTWLAVLGLYRALANRETSRTSAPLTQMQRPANADIPQNQPLLQPFPNKPPEGGEVIRPYRNTPATDLSDMRRAEQQALESYGWADQQRGTVRIPIAEAKRLVVERGLAVVPAATSTAGGRSTP